MSKTKTREIHFPGWQIWVFSLTANFIVLAIQPFEVLAQGSANNSTKMEIANNGRTNDLEPKILDEINRVRTTPQDYAQWLEVQRQYYDGIWLKLPGEKPVRTNRGRKALEEAIALLKEQQPLPPLTSSDQTAAAATSELKNFANSNNIQYFSYGRKTAAGIVMDLVVDELFPDRRRRQSLLSPEAEDTGVVCKPDPRYARVCAIAYSDSPALENPELENLNEVAIAESVSTTPENSPPSPEIAEETMPPVEKNPLTEPKVEAEIDSEAKTEAVAEVEPSKPQEDAAVVATLPVPPQPQVPSGDSVSQDDSQPSDVEKAKLEEELQLAQAETEIEQEQQELDNASDSVTEAPNLEPKADLEVETEDTETENIEEVEQSEVELEEESGEEETESEVEPEEEEAESSEIEDEQSAVIAEALTETGTEVAINTETAGFSEKIEQGRLEEGDRVIADDGSLYDFYPLQGKAGDSFTIYLESDDFDAFVALVDSGGKTIGENDDISQSDSNSQIEITLPADGVYNVIVNTYDENGTGEYTLKVSQ